MEIIKNQVMAVVGANWGDEGKGKITDLYADNVDMVVRFQGGANAGHTVINQYGKSVLHALPSGVFGNNTMNVIANGVALDIPKLLKEINELKEKGIEITRNNLRVSNRCQVLMPYHIIMDTLLEEYLAEKEYGTTRSGIGPFYADKYAKLGLQVSELYNDDLVMERLNLNATLKNPILTQVYNSSPLDVDSLFEDILEYREMIRPYICELPELMDEYYNSGKTILFEAQLGTLKDLDWGIYPMTTSSNTIASYGCVSTGIPSAALTKIVGVTKAYSCAVGGGHMVSEIHDETIANELRLRGGDKGEFGATTGRPRRIGWFDVPATKYGLKIQNATECVLTCIDVLGYLDKIPVCYQYINKDNGHESEFIPQQALKHLEPVFIEQPGWNCDIRGITDYNELPTNAKKYIDFIERLIEVPITEISTGPGRNEMCQRTPKI